jgi:hypothetical protein
MAWTDNISYSFKTVMLNGLANHTVSCFFNSIRAPRSCHASPHLNLSARQFWRTMRRSNLFIGHPHHSKLDFGSGENKLWLGPCVWYLSVSHFSRCIRSHYFTSQISRPWSCFFVFPVFPHFLTVFMIWCGDYSNPSKNSYWAIVQCFFL